MYIYIYIYIYIWYFFIYKLLASPKHGFEASLFSKEVSIGIAVKSQMSQIK